MSLAQHERKQAAAALLFRVRRVPIVLENNPELAGWERVSRAEKEEKTRMKNQPQIFHVLDLTPCSPRLKTRDKKISDFCGLGLVPRRRGKKVIKKTHFGLLVGVRS